MIARRGRARLVFPFDHHHGASGVSLRHRLGGKGANLAEMTTVLGLAVPPGFTITTDACRAYLSGGWPAHLDRQIDEALEELEASAGRRLGDPVDPLLVSVRSGARHSMPGMLDTVLNVGLNDRVRHALVARSGNEDFAWDCYRRFLLMYGKVVLRRDEQVPDGDRATSREACRALLAHDAQAYPDDPREQLVAAVHAVFASWNSPRALAFRQHAGLDDDEGTAVNVQAMVFGNLDERSGTGVAFTRDLSTGARVPCGEFLWQAQGEDVVAGTHAPLDLDVLAEQLPDVHHQLLAAFDHLEEHFADACEVEFTVESSRLWILQVRRAKPSGLGAIRVAVGLATQPGWSITREEAVARITIEDLVQAQRPAFEDDTRPLAFGVGASPGAAVGRAVFSTDQALEQSAPGVPVILVRDETSPADVRGMQVAEGVLTSRGGMVSHAAVVARSWGIPAVVGAPIEIEGDSFRVGGTTVAAGDLLSIDGSTGAISVGAHNMKPPALDGDTAAILSWSDLMSGKDPTTAGPEERLRAAHQRLRR